MSGLGSTVSVVIGEQATWNGVLLERDQCSPDLVRAGDWLADAAKAGDWEAVWAALDQEAQSGVLDVNQWRPGGRSWFTPLHQAAWLGAPGEVVDELLRRGAWKSITDSAGRRPVDIARERGIGGWSGSSSQPLTGLGGREMTFWGR